MDKEVKSKWLVLLTTTSGFDTDDVESTCCVTSFDTEEEADGFVDSYHLGPYEIMIFAVRGKSKY